MGTRALAKSVILQSVEDMYDPRYRVESLRFFSSGDFVFWAERANMDVSDQIQLLYIVHRITRLYLTNGAAVNESTMAGRATTSPQALPVPSQ